jgi:hypothetical protein
VKANVNRPLGQAGLVPLADMDPVRRWVATLLHRVFVTGPARPERPEKPAGVKTVSGVAVSGSVITITITMDDGATRHFQARLTETH